MSGAEAEARAAQARALLAALGVAATVEAVGDASDIAAVGAGLDELERVTAAAPEIRMLGFRFVALDVTPERE